MLKIQDVRENIGVNEFNSLINQFKCTLDPDIESFLKNKAVDFEKRRLSSTYLIFDEEKFANGKFFIEGYFTLTHKICSVSNCVSNNLWKKVFYGYSTKNTISVHTVLIAQLGKYINNEEKSALKANKILDLALSIIYKSNKYIACNSILIECRDIPQLKEIYKKNDFVEFQYIDGQEYPVQLICFVP